MVSIVVVSHSYPLATAAVELAREMTPDRAPRVAVAAGLDETTLGTDAMRIKTAVEEVDSPDGVLVLMDLGSAVLSAELALELLDPQTRSRVMLCPAPLVEGLIVAIVAAAGDSPLPVVASEASAALSGKQSHLAPEVAAPAGAPEPAPAGSAPTATGVFVVSNPHGLHARPAARLVAQLRELDALVTLRNRTTGAGPVPAGSLSRVATLGAQQGHELEVAAEGRQAQAAVDQLLGLAGRGFDDVAPPVEPAPAAPAAGGPLAAAPGVAVGPAWTPAAVTLEVPEEPAGDPASEWERLAGAIAQVRDQSAQLRQRTARELGEPAAAIFDAQLLLLDDADLHDRVRQQIEAGRSAEAGWAGVFRELAEQLAALADSYQRARAADARAVGEQVLHALRGVAQVAESREGVLVAPDLTPADVSQLDPDPVKGIVLAYGSPTAHSAILARALAIPMVVAAGPAVLTVPEGTPVALDGGAGELVIDPDQETREAYRVRAAAREQREAQARRAAAAPAHTRDGVAIEVAANLGSVPDAVAARAAGADSAGLVRTEFLFLDRAEAPDVTEQEQTYRAIAEALSGRRVTLRTLDVGGDKPLPYLPADPEANPFLGLRGIRLSLAHRELFYDQLVAACRVARDTPISLMFPMVSTLDELYAARELLDRAIGATGGGRPAGLSVGIMVEVPAAALKAEAFVPYVDFFSIGTNDLTQYTLAAERGNGAVATLADPLDPAVLRLVDTVCRAAAGRVAVAVCGEAGSDETAIPLLLGLGVRELSVALPAVPTVKQAVRAVDTGAAVDLARRALTTAGPAQARALVRSASGGVPDQAGA